MVVKTLKNYYWKTLPQQAFSMSHSNDLAVQYLCWNYFLTKQNKLFMCLFMWFFLFVSEKKMWTKGHWLVIYLMKPDETPPPQKGRMCRMLVYRNGNFLILVQALNVSFCGIFPLNKQTWSHDKYRSTIFSQRAHHMFDIYCQPYLVLNTHIYNMFLYAWINLHKSAETICYHWFGDKCTLE